jgi:hypothetical protein
VRVLLFCALLAAIALPVGAVDANTVEIVYSDNTATVTVASNISDYVMVVSGTSSHVIIIQSADFAGIDATDKNEDGEIIYTLSGTSDDGEFYLNGAYKCTVELNGLTLTNPRGPAVNIQNGKRIEVSVKRNTTNTLTDGANDSYNGCYHCKGHTKLKGNGTLNITGNAKHALYSKEYLEIKNLTLNITAAQKDGIHCREYMLIESGTINISGVADDAIQVELDGTTSTGTTTGHTDEDSGNFYMTGGRLTIGDYGAFAIKADGSIVLTGGTRNFDLSACLANATGIDDVKNNAPYAHHHTHDLLGRPLSTLPTHNHHIHIINGKKVVR